MRRVALALGLLTLAIVVFTACGQTSPAPVQGREVQVVGGSYRSITPEQLKSMLGNKDFLLVNVHIPYDGEIRGTDLFVPYNQIEQNLSQFPKERGAKIVVYCRSGYMSAIAARALVGMGFTNVWDVDGGMTQWEKRGYELINKPR